MARASGAGVLLVAKALEGWDRDFLVVDNPYLALSRILEHLHPESSAATGVHETAVVAQTAVVDASASVGPFSVIGASSRIDRGVSVASHVVIGRECEIGADSVLNPGVVLYDRTRIGARCILHAGVVVGSDGFGYAQDEGRHVKLRHLGKVVVEDDVEIGANSTIDRALLDETRIGAGSKIDNLVQVAHNVRLGKACILVSQSGIAGSTRLGDGVILAGQAGVSGHKVLGDGVQVAAKSAVFKSIEPGRKVAGIPAIDAAAWRRQQAIAARLVEIRKRLINLEKRIERLVDPEAVSE
ncbi:MAG: UDP-3-O-(3-hydroxymyristoyl)glucosamine N-acyltransferase [Acidobacteriota bacterium]